MSDELGREGSGVRGSVSPRVRARGRETGFERGARSDVRSGSEAEAARGGPPPTSTRRASRSDAKKKTRPKALKTRRRSRTRSRAARAVTRDAASSRRRPAASARAARRPSPRVARRAVGVERDSAPPDAPRCVSVRLGFARRERGGSGPGRARRGPRERPATTPRAARVTRARTRGSGRVRTCGRVSAAPVEKGAASVRTAVFEGAERAAGGEIDGDRGGPKGHVWVMRVFRGQANAGRSGRRIFPF